MAGGSPAPSRRARLRGALPSTRASTCTTRISAKGRCRNHGAFYHRERFGILTIEDHGSLNGTFVNGLQIKRKILFSGDVVLVGDYEIHVRHGSSEPQRTEAPFARIRTE